MSGKVLDRLWRQQAAIDGRTQFDEFKEAVEERDIWRELKRLEKRIDLLETRFRMRTEMEADERAENT